MVVCLYFSSLVSWQPKLPEITSELSQCETELCSTIAHELKRKSQTGPLIQKTWILQK